MSTIQNNNEKRESVAKSIITTRDALHTTASINSLDDLRKVAADEKLCERLAHAVYCDMMRAFARSFVACMLADIKFDKSVEEYCAERTLNTK